MPKYTSVDLHEKIECISVVHHDTFTVARLISENVTTTIYIMPNHLPDTIRLFEDIATDLQRSVK